MPKAATDSISSPEIAGLHLIPNGPCDAIVQSRCVLQRRWPCLRLPGCASRVRSRDRRRRRREWVPRRSSRTRLMSRALRRIRTAVIYYCLTFELGLNSECVAGCAAAHTDEDEVRRGLSHRLTRPLIGRGVLPLIVNPACRPLDWTRTPGINAVSERCSLQSAPWSGHASHLAPSESRRSVQRRGPADADS